MIKLVKVNKYFNRRKRNQMHIINNTSLELGDNGLVAILGSSGSGKTTLLNAIGGLDKVNSGKIYINGKKITHKRAYTVDKIRNLNMGYIFQDYKLLENMSVYDNVALSLKMMGIKNKKEIQKRVNYVLEAVKMYRYRNRPAKMLSGGEKQRVAIARALVKNPSIVIADEPTGNLDSKNSLQVMNIIKAISKEKLVILVTHEVDLANFYASRIIELQDGKIVKDYENEPKESLEYRLDNKLYLKDFENINNIDKDDINVNIYSDNKQDKINIKLAIKDGNIYIQSENKVEVVDENSSIELVDDHYKKIDKSIYDEEKYNLENISDKKYKAKYKSIYGIVKSIITGFKRISNYTILKKLLLLGFFASSMFVVYAICSIYGALDVRDIDFMQIDRNYLQVENTTISVDDFLKYEQESGIDYILPGSGGVVFTLNNKDYYQTATRPAMVNGYLVGIDTITADNLIKGRMPENEYEIVVDKRVVQSVTSDMGMAGSLGIKTDEDLLGRSLTIKNLKDFKIVGIADTEAESIFVNKSMFVNIIANATGTNNVNDWFTSVYKEETTDSEVMDYNLFLDDITLTKGRLPENDYEVIVNQINKDTMKLNKPIKAQVNGEELVVVGYYDSQADLQAYLVNNNTVKYNVINKQNSMTIYAKDKSQVMNKFKYEYRLNIIDRYEKDRSDYLEYKKDSVKSAIILASIILAISLVEIYLMMRASFLSRIKEIGVFRAIGVKKSDIYRMFLGEIIAITVFGSVPGIALMTYILASITKIQSASRLFIVNFQTIGLSVLIIFGVNILVGLLPLFKILRKRPARILARHDVE